MKGHKDSKDIVPFHEIANQLTIWNCHSDDQFGIVIMMTIGPYI
jgi:hypothetical protein